MSQHNPEATVTDVAVDEDGLRASSRDEVILDVRFDDRRVWSCWLQRDGERAGEAYVVAWPEVLHPFLDGTSRVTVVRHADQRGLFDDEVGFGSGQGRVEVVDPEGRPLGVDKSLRLVQMFDTRSEEQVVPMLDSVERVLAGLREAGVDAFVAYGTLLGAVRGGRLIGHDSDADLGYVSRHAVPVDVVRESFRLQRHLQALGLPITRYSGAAFRVDVTEPDGSIRGLDVFGGFLAEGHLHLMGELRVPFDPAWIFPLSSVTLEGRTLPAPAEPERFLAATYGEDWRTPDPAFRFDTPDSTDRRLTGWFRGTRVGRIQWDGVWAEVELDEPDPEPSGLVRWVREREPDLASYVDLGCGRGADAYWLAGQGVPSVGLDYVRRAMRHLAARAKDEGVPAEYRFFNLCEMRSVLSESARLAARPGWPRVVAARHVLEITSPPGRASLMRAADLMLRGGGRLYLELLTGRAADDEFGPARHVRPFPLDRAVFLVERAGGTVVHREEHTVLADGSPAPAGTPDVDTGTGLPPGSRRIGRVVAEWQR